MKLTIKRNAKLFKGVRFHFSESDNIEAKYNMNGGLWLRRITVKNDDEIIYIAKQKNWLKKLLVNPLKFIGIFAPAYPPFWFLKKGELVGKSIYRFLKGHTIQINYDVYVTHFHSKNYVSIFKNGEQIALLQRGDTIVLGSVDYNVLCTKEFYANRELLLLITAFIDIAYWCDTWRFGVATQYKTFGPEAHPERLLWTPED